MTDELEPVEEAEVEVEPEPIELIGTVPIVGFPKVGKSKPSNRPQSHPGRHSSESQPNSGPRSK